jgi:hypothetical protein
MHRFIFILVTFFFLLPSAVLGGEIHNIFGEGVFGTKWGMTVDEVNEIFPKGKKVKYGKIVTFEVVDGRKVLDIERRQKDKIVFGFDALGRLSSVNVGFKNDAEIVGSLWVKLDTLFGDSKVDGNDINPLADPALSLASSKFEWPVDQGISVRLVSTVGMLMFIDNLDLVITNHGLEKPDVSKESLGF